MKEEGRYKIKDGRVYDKLKKEKWSLNRTVNELNHYDSIVEDISFIVQENVVLKEHLKSKKAYNLLFKDIPQENTLDDVLKLKKRIKEFDDAKLDDFIDFLIKIGISKIQLDLRTDWFPSIHSTLMMREYYINMIKSYEHKKERKN